MKVAFAGTAPFGAAILEGLLDDGRHEVVLAISQPDRPAGRGKQLRAPAVAQLARERDVRLVQPERTHDPELLALYRELGVDAIVVAAFGQMIREPLLTDFLMLNVHGSLLPEYRGAAPIERAIMEGRTETGVCIMQMEAGLDTGPVAACATVHIGIDDDAGVVYDKLAHEGVRLLHDALDQAAAGTLDFRPQPDDGATYAHKITAEDRRLSFDAPVRAVHDRVRALSPHIGAFCQVDGQRLTIWKTMPALDHPAAEPGTVGAVGNEGSLAVACADGALRILEVQPAGKKRMLVADWMRGLRELPARLDAPD